MGVPAFFRWLSRKYAAIVVHCVEEKRKVVDGTTFPVDSSQPNPNDVEFDNLYLDMNGIIHPCTHPEDKPAPKNEAEMMVAIFEYIDRIFSIVRPRKLLYMAIDGVAPRAKMNQQRSRRFRASQEANEKDEDMTRIREEILSKGGILPPAKTDVEKFDSNCITPGTPFMFRLADCLRYYVHDRLNSDPGWRGIKIILSDANVPGEGEHKIMDYIRKQRGQPDHDPNTHHCLCGADADLIMLGLATHEPNFTIIREEFKPNQPRPCDICGQFGHETKECQGLPKTKAGEHDEKPKEFGDGVEFIFLRLCVLREYLERELQMDNLPFPYDFERALDDWVFMCFFVGNDFLPHLPSLAIRENAIDRLIRIYKKAMFKCGGYLTDSGVTDLNRVQLVLTDLGEVEDEIFKKRRDDDQGFRRRNKEKRRRMRAQSERSNRPSFMPQGQYAPRAVGSGSGPVNNPRVTAYQGRMLAKAGYGSDAANQDAAKQLKSMLTEDGDDKRGSKRKAEDSDSDPEPDDNVRLWEDGWKDRYYMNKFGTDENDMEFRYKVANEYVIGLCWVLRYYYQGCASWKWYFPFHYAPFASDFVNIGDLPNDFEKNTEPFKPLEQLMGVFPAASKTHLPEPWQPLMCEPTSPIIDFYPLDFKVDLNGKKYAWQGVVLLPFVDEKRLKSALVDVYPLLTDAEKKRNTRGSDRLFVSNKHPAFEFFRGLYEMQQNEPTDLETKLTQGLGGLVWCDEVSVMPGSTLPSPLPQCEDIHNNQALGVKYHDPKFDEGHIFPSKMLPGAKLPDRALKPEDFRKQDSFRPQLGFTRNSGYRGRGSYNPSVAQRTVRHSIPGRYGNVGPPQQQQQQSNRYQPYQRQNTGNSGYGGGMYGAQQGGYRPQWPQQQQQQQPQLYGRYGGQGGGGGGGNYATGQYQYQSGRPDDRYRRNDKHQQQGRQNNTYPNPSNYGRR